MYTIYQNGSFYKRNCWLHFMDNYLVFCTTIAISVCAFITAIPIFIFESYKWTKSKGRKDYPTLKYTAAVETTSIVNN